MKRICGIYKIQNIQNNKVYIGQSINILARFNAHKSSLNKKFKKHENEHLINAWHKYGEDSFKFEVIEECAQNELKDREMYYILKNNSNQRDCGYNLRMDTNTRMICSDSTREKFRILSKNRSINNPEAFKAFQNAAAIRWKDPIKKQKMALKVSQNKRNYYYGLSDENGNIEKVYKSFYEIKEDFPNVIYSCIFSVCNGNKKTHLKRVWYYLNMTDLSKVIKKI